MQPQTALKPTEIGYDRSSLAMAAERLGKSSPQEILEWAFAEFGERLRIATGFGAEGIVLIDMAVKLNPRPDIFFLDTGFLFRETYELRDRIQQQYGIEIRAVRTALSPEAQDHLYGPKLWAREPDRCCLLRKVEPLKAALRGAAAWVTAIRRDQTLERSGALAVEWDARWGLVKVNPLVRWTRKEVWKYIFQNGVPYNPLYDRGYSSIGCLHCTRAISAGEDERAGRWSGQQKTECGLHGGNALVEPGQSAVSILADASGTSDSILVDGEAATAAS